MVLDFFLLLFWRRTSLGREREVVRKRRKWGLGKVRGTTFLLLFQLVEEVRGGSVEMRLRVWVKVEEG